MNRRKRTNPRQLAREKILYRYSSALERGDLETVAAILRQAETDPVLEQMIWDMNQAYQMEQSILPSLAVPSLHLSTNHNHHAIKEAETMTTYTRTIERIPRASTTRWTSVTLAAAIIALVLVGMVLLNLQRPRDPQQDNLAALQGGTDTPTPVAPTSTPVPSLPALAPTTVPLDYVVEPGDTLVSILTRFSITLSQFASVNPELDYSSCDPETASAGADCQMTLFVGQTVRLPFSAPSSEVTTLVPTVQGGNNGSSMFVCQGFIIGSPQAEVMSVPSFDMAQSSVVGSLPSGAFVSVLQQRSPTDPGLPNTGWYFIAWESNNTYLTGWIPAELVQITGDCPALAPNPCQTPPPFDAPPTWTPTPRGSGGVPTGTATPFPTTPIPQPTVVPPSDRGNMPCPMTPTPTPFGYVPVVPGATPTAVFDSSLRFGGYDLITLEQVGEIPAGTRVRVGSAYYDGSQWFYNVVANDGTTSAQAAQSQLSYAPGATPGMIPPTMAFSDLLGLGGYSLVTTEDVGDIPAETYVRVWQAWWNGQTWIYQISDENGRAAEAREDQLRPAPGVTPGAPTPVGELFNVQGYNLVTLETVGDIPAGTLVQTTSGYYNGREWVYTVFTQDGRYADARAWQLSIVPGQPQVTPSSTPLPAVTLTFTPIPVPT